MLAYYFGFTNIRFLSTNIGILFCFCFKVRFLHTNIGILFLFYQHCIALHQYWYIIFCLPMLDSSIPLLVNCFPFTNIGFIYTKIGILFLFYQYWFPLYQYWHIIFFFLPMLDPSVPLLVYFLCLTNVGIYNILPSLVCHLLIPKINQTYANKKHTISQCLNLKFFPVLVSHTFWHTTKNGLRWIWSRKRDQHILSSLLFQLAL